MPLQRLLILSGAVGSLSHAPERPVALPGIVVRRATAGDGASFERDIASYSARGFEDRLSEHNSCYVAIEGDRLLHASWCSTGPTWTEELQTYLAPPQGDAYIYESFTRADARGRGIYPLVLRAIATDLYERGVARMWIGVEAGNEPSVRAIKKAGFEDVLSIGFSPGGDDVAIDAPEMDPEASLHIVTTSPDGPLGG